MQCTSGEHGLKKLGLKNLCADERGDVKRTVLLVVLLVVLVAAAVFLLFPDLISPPEPEPVAPAPSQIKRKVVQLPQPTSPQPAAEQAPAKPEAPAQPAAPAAAAPVEAPKPQTQAVAAEKPAPKPAPAPAPAEKSAPSPSAVGPKDAYTVTAGAFLLKSSVDDADKRIRELGFTPYHSKVEREIEVIRLKEGTYGEAEARGRAAQYQREFSAETFVLKGKSGWTVYLGSYVGLDRARVHADRLYAQGVRVTEEKALVPMALTLVRFGDFSDQAAAAPIVARAKAAGLEAYVSKVK